MLILDTALPPLDANEKTVLLLSSSWTSLPRNCRTFGASASFVRSSTAGSKVLGFFHISGANALLTNHPGSTLTPLKSMLEAADKRKKI